MKKKPKKLTVTVTKFSGTIAAYVAHSMTRDQLVTELKAREIPVPKVKNEMAQRLADHVRGNALPVTVTIG